MIKLKAPIIVEGKYDKITLSNIVDTLIISTDGFGIFKNKEKRDMIKALAEKNGIIVMTDSDSAGLVIRNHIKGFIDPKKIINVYVPCLKGKERRKDTFSKEGLLGVEGMSREVIEEALKKSGVCKIPACSDGRKITKLEFFELGFSGKESSREKRKSLLEKLGLPQNLSANAMLEILNTLYCRDELEEILKNG